jgi:hypothetical protein
VLSRTRVDRWLTDNVLAQIAVSPLVNITDACILIRGITKPTPNSFGLNAYVRLSCDVASAVVCITWAIGTFSYAPLLGVLKFSLIIQHAVMIGFGSVFIAHMVKERKIEQAASSSNVERDMESGEIAPPPPAAVRDQKIEHSG